MKILTVSASPYLLTKLGRMNSAVLIGLQNSGHEVSSAVWHHDISYFLPNEQGDYEFEKDGKIICKIHPFSNIPNKNGPAIYDIIKDFEPELVISIGDYTDTDFIFSVKSLMPRQFKWISILTMNTIPVNERRKDAFKFIDYAAVTNQMSLQEVKRISNVDVQLSPFGPNENFYHIDKSSTESEEFRVMNCSKNSQASSTAVFIKSVVDAHKIHPAIKGYLHSNISDRGDYDIDLLMDRFNAHDIIELPDNFTSLNDGISDEKLNIAYNKSDVIVDVSVRAATGLCLLEGMVTGCVPLVTNVGALGEIVGLLKDSKRFCVNSNMYIGQFEEYYEIVSPVSLTEKIIDLYKMKKNRPDDFHNCSMNAMNIAKLFSENSFVNEIKDIVEKIGTIDRKIDLEIL